MVGTNPTLTERRSKRNSADRIESTVRCDCIGDVVTGGRDIAPKVKALAAVLTATDAALGRISVFLTAEDGITDLRTKQTSEEADTPSPHKREVMT
jgi:hypothetical protein